MRSRFDCVRRALLAATVLALLSGLALAQRVPVLKARIDPITVKLGGQAVLVLEVENAQGGEVGTLPKVEGLRFGPVGAPGLSSYTEIVNGRMSSRSSLTWRLAVKPTQAGEFLIPPFTVRADGRELTTRELRLVAAEDFRGDELGLLEIDAPREVWQGMPFTLEIRVGFDTEIQGRLNRYDLALPWLGELGGLVELEDLPIPSGRSAGKILLNSREELEVEGFGTRKVGNANFYVLRVRKRFVATRPGSFTFPASHFEFGHRSDQFQRLIGGTEDFSNFKRAPEFQVLVKAIPEEGRPIDWSGAVGTFEGSMIADRRDVQAGESIKLTVEWTGEGNLEFFDAPDLRVLDTFRSFGVLGTQGDRKTPSRRAVTYDIAPKDASLTEIPGVPLQVFDTASGRYATVTTKPIPIRVRPLVGATGLPSTDTVAATTADLRDIQTRAEDSSPTRAPSGSALGAIAGSSVVGWLALRAFVRRRGDPDAPRERARRRARRELERALRGARTPEEQAQAVHAFLAARSGEPPQAWAGRDPVAWSRARAEDAPRIATEDALALRQLLARLDAAVWGGGNGSLLDQREVLTLADRVAAGGL